MMFLASSETAVAMRVRSTNENPSLAPNSLDFCRAVTMSKSTAIGTRTSSRTAKYRLVRFILPSSTVFGDVTILGSTLFLCVQVGQSLFQIERGSHSFQGQT